jgi:ASC-1-like (ASCH) protein
MMSDTALYSVALHLTQGSRCHVVDPLLVTHQNHLEESPTPNLLDVLHNGLVLALPYNDPEKHWWMVFALLSADGKTVQLTHRNSCAAWDGEADASIRNTMTLLTRLLESTQYNVNKHGPFSYKVIPSVDPPRQRQANSCGIHCCAHSLLAAKGQIFHRPRTFDSRFIDNLRDRALLYYHGYRVASTRVIVIDLLDGDDRIRRRSMSSIKPHKRKVPTDHIDVSPQPKRARKGLFRDLSVQREYISPIQLDVKTIEGRPNIDKYHDWEVGDVIRFTPSGGSRRGDLPCHKLIIRMAPYPSFRSMLKKESVSACLPNITSLDDAVDKYRSFHRRYPKLEEDFGVVAFELGPWKPHNQ